MNNKLAILQKKVRYKNRIIIQKGRIKDKIELFNNKDGQDERKK